MFTLLVPLLSTLVPLLPNFALNALHDHLTTQASVETNKDNLLTQERLARTKAEVDRRNAQRDVLVAEQQHWETRAIRLAFAIPVAAYLGKLILWDKVLGWGTTDDLSDHLWAYADVVVGGYFLDSIAQRFARRQQ